MKSLFVFLLGAVAVALATTIEKRDLDCRELGESCRLVPRCCGSTQCYWEGGYSLTRTGVCVTCISEDLACQRDAQCCEDLVCQKGKAYHKNGLCQPKRANNEPCHEDDQCASGNCDQAWYQFSEGECSD